MKFKEIKISEIVTKTVKNHSGTSGYIYLPKSFVGKKVFVILPESDSKYDNPYGLNPLLLCETCGKPFAKFQGIKDHCKFMGKH